MATLDELLKSNLAWLEQAVKRPVFDKADETTIKFPEEQRARRMQDVKVRIEDLSRRKEEAVASYDRAIALERAELDSLASQEPPAAPPSSAPTKDDRPQ